MKKWKIVFYPSKDCLEVVQSRCFSHYREAYDTFVDYMNDYIDAPEYHFFPRLYEVKETELFKDTDWAE